MHGTHDVSVRGQRLRIRHAGDAEIADLDLSVARDHDILGLNVSVHDAALMRMRKRSEHLQGAMHRIRLLHPAALADQILECRSVDVFHRDVRNPADHAGVDHIDDIGMIELFADLRLALEARLILGVVFVFLAQNLERDELIGLIIKRAINDRHTAPAENVLNAEASADHLADQS